MKKVSYLSILFFSGLIISFFLSYLKEGTFLMPEQFKSIANKIEVADKSSEFGKRLVKASRKQIGVVTQYDTGYFADAKVPENSGVCADVIWRALTEVGYDLRAEIDKDVKKNPNDYPNVDIPDDSIDFRRVKNLKVFFDKYAEKLTLEVIPGNVENLTEWQSGDLVTFDPLPDSGLTHIVIISDKRRSDGVPLLIHNYGRGTVEDDYLINWPTKITGHYRVDKIVKNRPLQK